jgi:hypothetical protein
MASNDTDLTCAICLELSVEPCTLSCMHSYCKTCMVNSIKNDSSNKCTITCPGCRHVENIGTHDQYVIKKNSTLANIDISKYEGQIQKDDSRQSSGKYIMLYPILHSSEFAVPFAETRSLANQ